MSGRGQHFIPRHFQKPFVASEIKDQIWMYRRGKSKAMLVARGDAGKEHDFYSPPSADGSQTLDDIITVYEERIFPMVDMLRRSSVGSKLDPEICAEVVVHFFVRSQYLRKSISELWSGLAKTIYALATDPTAIVGNKRLPAHRPPAAIASALKEQIVSRQMDAITGVSVETLVRIFYMGLREKLDELTTQARETVATIASQFGDQAKEKMRDAHREMLLSSLAPIKRIEQLRALNWTIIDHPNSATIIPDCVCIAANSLGVWQPILLAEEVSLIVMPLTPEILLIGKSDLNKGFDPEEFNSHAARACFDFFLSKENVKLDSILDADLGQSVRIEFDNIVSHKVLDAIDAFLTTPMSQQSQSLNKLKSEIEPQIEYGYQLTLFDFGDENFAYKLALALGNIVKGGVSEECYGVLDGFTFANDYEYAINAMDRGFEPSHPIRSTNSPLGIGVAIPLTVKRDQLLKTRFVLRGFLADYILGDNDEDRASAESTIRYLLAGLELDLLLRTRFSGWMLQRIVNPIEDYLYSHAHGAFDTYFGMRRSAYNLGDAIQHLQGLEDNLQEMVSMCVERRRLYRVNSDLDAFLSFAFELANILLGHVARILGTFAGVEGERVVPDKLSKIFVHHEMGDWITLFSNDLADFYENIGSWEDFECIFFINRHFERLLIFFGVIIEERDDGQFYAHVPYGSDGEYLSQLNEQSANSSP